MAIHPAAIVDPQAQQSPTPPKSVRIASSGADVEIGARTRLMAHVYVEGPTLHRRRQHFLSVFDSRRRAAGSEIQRRALPRRASGTATKSASSSLFIAAPKAADWLTAIGDDNLLMAYVHVAHDVRIGNHTILANAVTFAGHVTVEDWAVIEAFSGVHQFCRIGKPRV